MNLSEDHLARVKEAIEALRAATNTELGMTSNETIRDGSHVFLKSDEGWYISVVGGLRQHALQDPCLALNLIGFVHNAETNLLEALTLHHVTIPNTSLDLQINDSDTGFVTPVLEQLVPAVRAGAKQLHDRWAAEQARKDAIAALEKEFDIVDNTAKKTVGGHPVKLVIGYGRPAQDPELSLTLENLSPDQVRAIFQIIKGQ